MHFYVPVKHFALPGVWMVRYKLAWPHQLSLVGKRCNNTVSEYFKLSGLYFLLFIGQTMMECYQVQFWTRVLYLSISIFFIYSIITYSNYIDLTTLPTSHSAGCMLHQSQSTALLNECTFKKKQ